MDEIELPDAKRRPLNPSLLLTLALLPEDALWVPVIYGEGFEKKWSEADIAAFESLGLKGQREAIRRHLAGHRQSLPEPAPERRQSRTRQDRLEARRIVPGIRYVRRHSLDPVMDARLSSGACRTLAYLIARIGKGLWLRTVTCWIAQALAVTTRTIQNHYKLLEAAGYIVKSAPDKRGCTKVYLTLACEPPAYKKSSSKTKNLANFGAKESSHNQSIKEVKKEKKEGTGNDQAEPVSVTGLSPADPLAELGGKAPPADRPTEEQMMQEPCENREDGQRPGKRSRGVSGGASALSVFNQEMSQILGRFEDAFRERQERPT